MTTLLRPPGPRTSILKWTAGWFLNRHKPDAHLLGSLMRLAERYGDVARFRLGLREVYFVNHPDLVRDVLVTQHRKFLKSRGLEGSRMVLGEGLLTSEGEFHLRHRRLIQPAFHPGRMPGYARVMVERTATMEARWRDGAEVDAHQEMMELTVGIAGETLFGAEVGSEAAEIGRALTELIRLFPLTFLPFYKLFLRLPLPVRKRYEESRRRLDASIYRMIGERRKRDTDRGDLLSILLAASDGGGGKGGPGKGLNDVEVRDEAMTLFLAGHETTANALAWTWFLLSRSPEVEAKLHQEVDRVLGGRLPGYQDLDRLPYARSVFAESLRLYPPAWVLGRRAAEDTDLGGYFLPRETTVLISPFVLHRTARFFHDPERFDPERWTPEADASRPPYAYIPFGGGPRNCIGESFAWMEGVLVLATLARAWRLRSKPGREPSIQPIFTLRPLGGLPLVLERRAAR
jgi:cytochrome P450